MYIHKSKYASASLTVQSNQDYPQNLSTLWDYLNIPSVHSKIQPADQTSAILGTQRPSSQSRCLWEKINENQTILVRLLAWAALKNGIFCKIDG